MFWLMIVMRSASQWKKGNLKQMKQNKEQMEENKGFDDDEAVEEENELNEGYMPQVEFADEEADDDEVADEKASDEEVVDEETSNEGEASEGSEDEVHGGEEGAELQAAYEEEDADVEGREDGADGYQHDEDVHDHTKFGWMGHSIDYDAYHETIRPSHKDEQIVKQINEQKEETHMGKPTGLVIRRFR
ncbi:hypothetical protein Scep_019097 [Stephania cephalantha]|uniref:Uncharacterized protein n=1 Tax=Stephania cephalantha TaxID=152367 RepID=A0AAP0NLU1_9MAGN